MTTTNPPHPSFDGPESNPRCPLCAPSWPPARTMPRIRISTAAAVAAAGTATAFAVGFLIGWETL